MPKSEYNQIQTRQLIKEERTEYWIPYEIKQNIATGKEWDTIDLFYSYYIVLVVVIVFIFAMMCLFAW